MKEIIKKNKTIIYISTIIFFILFIFLLYIAVNTLTQPITYNPHTENEFIIDNKNIKTIAIIASDMSNKSEFLEINQLKNNFSYYDNIKTLIFDSGNIPDNQGMYIRDLIAQNNIDMIIIYPFDVPFVKDSLNEAKENNIPIILAGNHLIENHLNISYIPEITGKLITEYLIEYLPGNTSILILSDNRNDPYNIKTFKEISNTFLNTSFLKSLDYIYTNEMTDVQLLSALKKYLKVDAIIIQGEKSMDYLPSYLRNNDYIGQIICISSDEKILLSLLSKEINGFIYKDIQKKADAIYKVGIKYIQNKTADSNEIFQFLITQDNIDDFIKNNRNYIKNIEQ